jgi:hypothetical protein
VVKPRSEETPHESRGDRPGEAPAASVAPIPLLTPVPLSPPFAAVDLAAQASPCRPEEPATTAPPAAAGAARRGASDGSAAGALPRLGYDTPAGCESIVSAETRYTGDVLRRVRAALGITMAELCERTRIPRSHLENVEADRYEKLPAPVYLRGILLALAKELRLDGQRVARSYLEEAAGAASPRRDA